MTTMHAAADVDALTTDELLTLFRSLACPAIDEMDGEYAARLLKQPNAFAAFGGRLLTTNPLMFWRGKAFRPVDATTGRGYNHFDVGGRVVQRFPMHTELAPSRFDGRPAYQLVYRAFASACGDINMVDEIRRLAPGVYLGIGTCGFTDAQRRIGLPFLLEGPTGAYRGDIGRARRGFRIGRRELPGKLTTEK